MLVHVLLALFVLRTAVPADFMPDLAALADGRVTITVCTMAGFKTVTLGEDGKPVSDSSDKSKPAQKDCPFFAGAVQAFDLAQPAVLPRPVFAAEAAAASDFFTLHPPAQGPPLGSRAPPSFS